MVEIRTKDTFGGATGRTEGKEGQSPEIGYNGVSLERSQWCSDEIGEGTVDFGHPISLGGFLLYISFRKCWTGGGRIERNQIHTFIMSA